MKLYPHSNQTVMTELQGQTIVFPYGIPRWEDDRSVVLKKHAKYKTLFYFESTIGSDLDMFVVASETISPDLRLNFKEEDVRAIFSPKLEDCITLIPVAIVKELPDGKVRVKANVLSPILVNNAMKKAGQFHQTDAPDEYMTWGYQELS